jgi:hypothetical protein
MSQNCWATCKVGDPRAHKEIANVGKSDGGSAFKQFSPTSLVRSSGDPLIELLAFFVLGGRGGF